MRSPRLAVSQYHDNGCELRCKKTNWLAILLSFSIEEVGMNPGVLPVFVYGTLMRGEVREPAWPHPPKRVTRATTAGQLYDLGPYPAMISGKDAIVGELWWMHAEHMAETLHVLDDIECFGRDEVDLYVRTIVRCQTEDGETVSAHAYYFADPKLLAETKRVLPDDSGCCRWSRQSQ